MRPVRFRRITCGAHLLVALVALIATACAPTFAVPPHLVAAWPGFDATLPRAPAELDLTFNRALAADSSVHVVRLSDGWEPRASAVGDQRAQDQLDVHLDDRLTPAAYVVQWHAVAARSLAVLDGEYSFVVTGESGRVPHLAVTPDTTDAGQVIEVNGQGFGANQAVDLTIGDDRLSLGSALADKQGNFSIDLRTPPQVASGVQPVSALDASGDQVSAAVRVHWGGWPPLLAWTTGVAGPLSGDVSFGVTVQNRSDYVLEGVSVEMGVPDGASLVSVDRGGRELQGVLTWDLGLLDRGIAAPLHVTFHTDRQLATHATIRFRHRRPHDCTGDECLTAFVSETVSDSVPVAP